jgi:hypothetical protein
MGPHPLLASDLGNLERELALAAFDADRSLLGPASTSPRSCANSHGPPVGSVRDVHKHAHQVARHGRGT